LNGKTLGTEVHLLEQLTAHVTSAVRETVAKQLNNFVGDQLSTMDCLREENRQLRERLLTLEQCSTSSPCGVSGPWGVPLHHQRSMHSVKVEAATVGGIDRASSSKGELNEVVQTSAHHRKWFHDITDGTMMLSPKELSRWLDIDVDVVEQAIKTLTDSGDDVAVVMDYETLQLLLSGKETSADHKIVEALHTMKEAFHARFADEEIAVLAGVDAATLADDVSGHWSKIYWLEPASACVICVNATIIWLSLDHSEFKTTWTVLEMLCVAFFCLELILKLRYCGCTEFLTGKEWRWNLFDSIIVTAALVDFALQNEHGDIVGAVRLLRFLKFARLMKLLHLKMFKDLKLMVSGVINGLQTLFWAFVFLWVLVYTLGVTMRQMVSSSGGCDKTIYLQDHECTEMFATVYRSMFTVFRCITAECDTPDGVPLVPILAHTYGIWFTFPYVIVMCFVTFGLFNLIMAVFVERTLEYSKLDFLRHEADRHREQVQLARDLKALVLKMSCHSRAASVVLHAEAPGLKDTLTQSKFRQLLASPLLFWRHHKIDHHSFEQTMKVKISLHEFDQVVHKPDVRTMLEDLDIYVTNTTKLFRVLDSNDDGQLEIREIAEGLMRLRGPVDKADTISPALMIKTLQKDIQDIKQLVAGAGRTSLGLRSNTAFDQI